MQMTTPVKDQKILHRLSNFRIQMKYQNVRSKSNGQVIHA